MKTDNAYSQTAAIKKGEYQLPPVIAGLFQWMRDNCNMKPVNVIFETYGSLYSQSIYFVIETKEKGMISAGSFHDAIAAKFSEEIFKKEHLSLLAAHGTILPLKQKKIPDIMLTFVSLEEFMLRGAIEQLGDGHDKITARYPSLLWKIQYAENRFIIFYFTEQQRTESDENGTTDKIIGELMDMLKAFDDLDLITLDLVMKSNSLVVDSKETFDTQFGGQEWQYFR